MIMRMILKLDPGHPLVWRSPDTIQLGVDRVVAVVDGVTPAIEVMLFALRAGVPRSGLYMLGEEAGADQPAITAFLKRVGPALVVPVHDRHHAGSTAGSTTALHTRTLSTPASVHIDGDGPSANRLRIALGELGIRVCASDAAADAADLVILFGSYVFAPERHRRWLRRDIPHLPVLFGDNGARIGPLVEPGNGPCLFCVELERADADSAWPAIAAQLLRQHPPVESVRLGLDIVARVAALVDDHLVGRTNGLRAVSLGVDHHGHVTRHGHRVHERCGCGVLPGAATLTPESSRMTA